MAKYRMVREEVEYSVYEFECSLDSLIEKLEELKSKYGASAHFDICGVGYDGGIEVHIVYEREETEKERDRRLAKAHKERVKKAAYEAKREERERAKYEKLHAKYGK